MRISKILFACSLFIVISIFSFASNALSIRDAINAKQITATFTSKGGHSGDCVSLGIQNLSSDTISLYLEGGEKLFCDDTTCQNILVAENYHFNIPPKEKKSLSIRGFCCALHKHSPPLGKTFKNKTNDNEGLIELGRFLATHSEIPNNAMQDAVWVISDEQDISTIYGQSALVDPLIKEVARIKKVMLPWYKKQVQLDKNGFPTGKVIIVEANYIFSRPSAGPVTIVVFNEKDERIHTVCTETLFQKGLNLHMDKWNTANLTRGRYIARIFSGTEMIEEKSIIL
jgi:hypothetical protein